MDAFAIHNEVQYQPASSIAPAERLLVVVPGALRNSDLYVAHAQAAGADQTSTLIVAPQFLGDVDVPRPPGPAANPLLGRGGLEAGGMFVNRYAAVGRGLAG